MNPTMPAVSVPAVCLALGLSLFFLPLSMPHAYKVTKVGEIAISVGLLWLMYALAHR
jgi:hypothetical protein